LFSVKLS